MKRLAEERAEIEQQRKALEEEEAKEEAKEQKAKEAKAAGEAKKAADVAKASNHNDNDAKEVKDKEEEAEKRRRERETPEEKREREEKERERLRLEREKLRKQKEEEAQRKQEELERRRAAKRKTEAEAAKEKEEEARRLRRQKEAEAASKKTEDDKAGRDRQRSRSRRRSRSRAKEGATPAESSTSTARRDEATGSDAAPVDAKRARQAVETMMKALQGLAGHALNGGTAEDRAKLEAVVRAELPAGGAAQEAFLKAEVEKVLEETAARAARVRSTRTKLATARNAETAIQESRPTQDQEAECSTFMTELEDLVNAAEAASKKAEEAVAPLREALPLVEKACGSGPPLGPVAARAEARASGAAAFNSYIIAGEAVEDAGSTALAACAACSEFMLANQQGWGAARAEVVKSDDTPPGQRLDALEGRLRNATKQTADALSQAADVAEPAAVKSVQVLDA